MLQENGEILQLKDNRRIEFADEPDIAIYLGDQIKVAIEVKGGIDTAGVLERIGAALKSLSRAKAEPTTPPPDSKAAYSKPYGRTHQKKIHP